MPVSDSFKKLAKSKSTSPPPRWPDFPLPEDVAKRFPSMRPALDQWNEQVKEYFRQSQISSS